MIGLRIYVKADDSESGQEARPFYSRRDDGPFYRWQLDKGIWSVSRVSSPDFLTSELSATSWKMVPAGLQKSIAEHYQD